MKTRRNWFSIIGPGILVAATGVGAGDIITAALGGSALGLAILWAAVVGAVLKWFLNEGITRWQMATDTTILQGWCTHMGKWFAWLFFLYLLAWTFFTGGALVTACGVAGHALLPLGSSAGASKIIWGILHSLLGYVLVRAGGYKLFERMMAVFITIMFAAVVLTAILVAPRWTEVAASMVIPRIPPDGLGWVIGVLGGVGGTVTLLSYGYWIREEGREGLTGLKTSRLDLAVGYIFTAIFGVCMIIIGSGVTISGTGVNVAPILAAQLESGLGALGKWTFLVGFWGAVFSSLLGVWQSVPYLFADFLSVNREALSMNRFPVAVIQEKAYQIYLAVITLIPLTMLWVSVRKAQLIYAVTGAFFMPILAATLLYLNNRKLVDKPEFRNGTITNATLLLVLGFFITAGTWKAVSLIHALF